MARFSGNVAYNSAALETEPGVFTQGLVIKRMRGDVLTMSVSHMASQQKYDDVHSSNVISILGDAYSFEHYQEIAYVEWQNSKWAVQSAQVDRPRIKLTLGGVYHE